MLQLCPSQRAIPVTESVKLTSRLQTVNSRGRAAGSVNQGCCAGNGPGGYEFQKQPRQFLISAPRSSLGGQDAVPEHLHAFLWL